MKKILVLLQVASVFACQTNPHQANIEVVKEYVEAVESLDYDAMDNLLSDTYEGYGPSAGDTIQKAAAVASWKKNVEELYKKIVVMDGTNKMSPSTQSCRPMKGRNPRKMSGSEMCGGATDFR